MPTTPLLGVAVLAVVFLAVGGFGLASPPGVFGFTATSCSPTGDCANYTAPMFLSLLSAVGGGLLTLWVGGAVVRSGRS